MDQQINLNSPPVLPPQGSLNKSRQIAAIAVAGILVIGGISVGAYYLWQKSVGDGNRKACTMEAKLCPDGSSVGRIGPDCEFDECPSDPTVNWQTYTSTALGFTFKYPNEYGAPQERENYLSLISPLNPNRIPKMLELQDGELKIEIVVEPGQENDSSLKCWNDHSSDSGRLTGQTETSLDGVQTVLLTWEGLGTGQFLCVNNNGRRYLINKYPAETTRQKEYDGMIATFKFLK